MSKEENVINIKIADKYYSIAVCGTHGKTTITNMIKHVLSNIDDVSYLVGDGQGKGSPHSKYFVMYLYQ